jgi:hypothetical protein
MRPLPVSQLVFRDHVYWVTAVTTLGLSLCNNYATGWMFEGLCLYIWGRGVTFCFLHTVQLWCFRSLVLNQYRGPYPLGVQLTTHPQLLPRLKCVCVCVCGCVCVYIYVCTTILSCGFMPCAGNSLISYIPFVLNTHVQCKVHRFPVQPPTNLQLCHLQPTEMASKISLRTFQFKLVVLLWI